MFKVLRSVNDRLYSAVAPDTTWGIEYTPNKWIYPSIPNSRIFVFDSLKNAKDFIRNERSLEIWECCVLNPSDAKYKTILEVSFSSISKEYMEMFWSKKLMYAPQRYTPTGTVFCDAIKLTNKIQ